MPVIACSISTPSSVAPKRRTSLRRSGTRAKSSSKARRAPSRPCTSRIIGCTRCTSSVSSAARRSPVGALHASPKRRVKSSAGAHSRAKPATSSDSRSGWSSDRERVAVLDPLHAGAAQVLGQRLGVLGREEAVLLGPGDQGRLAEAAQQVGRPLGVALVDAADEAREVVAHRLVGERRQQVGVLGLLVDRPLGQPAERQRSTAQLADAHRRQQRRDQAGRPGQRLEVAEGLGREVVAVVAGGEHQAADPLGLGGHHHLAQGAAGVVAHQRHVLEPQLLDRLGDRRRHRARGHLAVPARGPLVRAQRQLERHRPQARLGQPAAPPCGTGWR